MRVKILIMDSNMANGFELLLYDKSKKNTIQAKAIFGTINTTFLGSNVKNRAR